MLTMGVLKHIKYINKKRVIILLIPILIRKALTAPKNLPKSITNDVINKRKISLKLTNELKLLLKKILINLRTI